MGFTWPTKKLDEVCELVRGSEPGSTAYIKRSEDAIPFLRVGDLSGKVDDLKFVSKDLENLTMVDPDEVLITFDGTPGIVAKGLKGAISSGIRVVRDIEQNKILKDFLFYCLQTTPVQDTIRRYTIGITILHASRAIPHIKVPVPSRSTQQKIVERLNAIKKAQELNDKQIELAEELFQSLLNREVKSKTEWRKEKLFEIAEVRRGKFTPRPRNDPKYFGGTIPWIQIGEITGAKGGYITTYSQTLNEKGLRVSRTFPKGTIVMGIAASIGEIAILGIEAAFPDSIVGIIPDEQKVKRPFLFYQLILAKPYLNARATQVAQKNINLQILSRLKIPLPSLKTQGKIIEKLSAIQDYKRKLLEQKHKLQELFDSAFKKSIREN